MPPFELRGSSIFKKAIRSCVAYDARERPTMQDVVRSLKCVLNSPELKRKQTDSCFGPSEHFFWMKNHHKIKALAAKTSWDMQDKWNFTAPSKRNAIEYSDMRHADYQRAEQQRPMDPRRTQNHATPRPPLVREIYPEQED